MKKVPEDLKVDILLNILTEKVTNLIVYVTQEGLASYDKLNCVKFQQTPVWIVFDLLKNWLLYILCYLRLG